MKWPKEALHCLINWSKRDYDWWVCCVSKASVPLSSSKLPCIQEPWIWRESWCMMYSNCPIVKKNLNIDISADFLTYTEYVKTPTPAKKTWTSWRAGCCTVLTVNFNVQKKDRSTENIWIVIMLAFLIITSAYTGQCVCQYQQICGTANTLYLDYCSCAHCKCWCWNSTLRRPIIEALMLRYFLC